jgi:Lar family restriction alleviation protein
MTDEMEVKLLPCPFCGGAAEWHDITEDDEVANVGGSCIICTVCQACGPVQFGEKDTIVEQWNRRALRPAGEASKYHLIFDGSPGPDGPRFIELENDAGHSIGVGEWVDDPRHPGWAQFVLPAYASPIIDAKVVDKLGTAFEIGRITGQYATPTAANASDGDGPPKLEDAYRDALAAAEVFYDAASYEETLWTGWGEQTVPASAEMRRVKAKQALTALRDADPRRAAAPASPDTKEQGRG